MLHTKFSMRPCNITAKGLKQIYRIEVPQILFELLIFCLKIMSQLLIKDIFKTTFKENKSKVGVNSNGQHTQCLSGWLLDNFSGLTHMRSSSDRK